MKCLNRLGLAALLVWLVEPTVGLSLAQQTDSKDEKSTQEPDKNSDEATVERFVQILLRRPRVGPTFDKAYAHYADRGTLDDFTNDLEKRFADEPNGNVAMLLGLVAMQRGQDARAIEWLLRAEKNLPQDAIASFYLAQCYMNVGQKAEAFEAFERAIAKRPVKADALQILEELGRIYQRDGQAAKALEVWQRLEQMFPADLQVQQQVAQILVEEGVFLGAADRYERLAVQAKNKVERVEMRWRAAKLRSSLDDSKAAQRELEQLIGQVNPDSWLHEAIRSDIDQGYLDKYNYDGLVAYYSEWIEQHPDDLDAMLRLAKYLPAGDGERAKEWVARAIQLAPSARAPLVVMADLLERELDFAKAAETMKRLVALEPSNVDFVHRYGQCVARNTKLDESERHRQAIEIWRSLLSGGKHNAISVAKTAELLRGIKAEQEAIELYTEAIHLAENEPQYREYLGEYLHQLGRTDQALTVWREIATGDRAVRDNFLRLSELLHKFKFPVEALDAMKSACELQPLFTQRMQYATMLRQAKRYAEALEQLDAAEKLAVEPEERLRLWNEQIATFTVMGTLEQRAVEFKKRIEAGENATAEAWLRLALMQEARVPFEAASSIRRAIRMEPTSRIANDVAVRIFDHIHQPDESLSALNRLIKIDPRSRTTYLKRMVDLYNAKGDLNAALKAAREMISSNRSNAEYYSMYADLCFRMDRDEEGLAALRRNLRMNPNDSHALSALAGRLSTLHRDAEASELAWRALDVSKGMEQMRSAVDTLARFYKQRENTVEFRKRLLQLADRGFRQREMTLVIAHGLRLIGETERAAEQLEKQLVGDGRDRELLIDLIQMCEHRSDYVKALEYQQRLCKIENSKEANLRLAQFEFAAGETAEALMRLQNLRGEKVNEGDFSKLIEDLESNHMYLAAASVAQAASIEFPQDWEILAKALINNHRAGSKGLAKQNAQTILGLNLPFDTPARALADLSGEQPALSVRRAWLERSIAVGDKLDIPIAVLKYGLNNLPRDVKAYEEIREWWARSNSRALKAGRQSFMSQVQVQGSPRNLNLSPPAINLRSRAVPSVDMKISVRCYGDARAIALSLPLIADGFNEEAELNAALIKCGEALTTKSADSLWEAIMLLCRASDETRQVKIDNANRQLIDALLELEDRDAVKLAIEFVRSKMSNFPAGRLSLRQGVVQQIGSRASHLTLSNVDRHWFHELLQMQAQFEGGVSFDDAILLSLLHFNANKENEAMEALELTLKAQASTDRVLTVVAQFSEVSVDGASRLLVKAYKGQSMQNWLADVGLPNSTSNSVIGYSAPRRQNLFDSTLSDFFSQVSGKPGHSVALTRMLGDLIDIQAENVAGLDAPEFVPGVIEPSVVEEFRPFDQIEANGGKMVVAGEFLCSSQILPMSLKLTVKYLSRDAESARIRDWMQSKATASEASPQQLATARCCLAYWHWLKKEPEAALATIRSARATEVAPNILKLYESQMLLDFQHPREAIELASQIASDSPVHTREREMVILSAALHLGDNDQAGVAIDRLMHANLDPQKQIKLAQAMLRLGMNEQAKALLGQLRNTNDESLYASLLSICAQSGFKAETTELSEHILSTVRTALDSSASSTVRTTQNVSAFSARWSSQVTPPSLDEHFAVRNQAVAALKETGEINAAIERFEKKLTETPTSQKITYALVALYRAIGNDESAENTLAEYRGNTIGSPSTLVQIARDYAMAEKHSLAVKIYLKALRLKPAVLENLNAFRKSIVDYDMLPVFCRELQVIGIDKFNEHPFMLFSIGRELLRSENHETTFNYTSTLLDQFGIRAIPGLLELNSATSEDRFHFLNDALADKVASNLIEHCKLTKATRLDSVIDPSNGSGAWEAIFNSLERYPAARARVLTELVAIDEQQRTESAKLVLTLLYAASDRDIEAEQQFAAILNSPDILLKLGVRAVVDMYTILSRDLAKPEMAARVLEQTMSKATESHLEWLKDVGQRASR